MSKLFAHSFPIVTKQSDLDALFKEYPSLDPYYIASASIPERRIRFEKFYDKVKGKIDANFLKQIPYQFHQRTWEMYLAYVLESNGYKIQPLDVGPDFRLDTPVSIWIEATAPSQGQVPPMGYGVSHSIPTDEIQISIASALKTKHEKYESDLKKGIIKTHEPYVIAINAGVYGYPEPVPIIFKCLFEMGWPTISFPVGGGKSENGWSRVPYIKKPSGEPIAMNFFLDNKYSGISAVIYSSTNVLNHPEEVGSDCLVVHNPEARNPLDRTVFNFLKQEPGLDGKIDTNFG